MSFIVAYRRPKAKLQRMRSDSSPQTPESLSEAKKLILLTYDDLPDWYRDNRFTRSGYRPASSSWLTCAGSLGHLHNETVNIYTHLVPAICLLFGQVIVYNAISYTYPESSMLDRVVFGCNLGAATITMILSTVYHTMMNHSSLSNLMLRVDYVGILTLILGSFFSGIYVGFYCEPSLRLIYWTMIIAFSIITSTLVLHPRVQGLKYRTIRTWAFIATALSGFAPITHGIFLYGWKQMWVRSGMPYYFLEGITYGLGAFFFVTRIPESIWPGKFDIWFASHQIFHVFVVLASLVHLYGVWVAFGWNYEHQRTSSVKI